MYTGILDFENQTGSDIFDLLVASDELLLEETVIFVQKYLIENESRTTWYQRNFIKVLHTVFQLERKNTNNLSSWSKEDFIALKNTLSQFMLHIRFLDITSRDFYNHIWPFKEVLPAELFEEIHATILANWIEGKEADAKIPKDRCILIIKVQENGSIIGGYNPLGWNSNQIGHDGDGNNFRDFKLCRVTNSSRAIYNNDLNFGNSDLVVNVNKGTCDQLSYQGRILDINAFTMRSLLLIL
ncbi:8787_t:CDS:2 [Funneliformis geosporum]|nr:8787_t:CDS:2 [Funneliformis geosporum]